MNILLLAMETALVALLCVAFWLSLLAKANLRWMYMGLGLPLVFFPVVGLGSITWMSYVATFHRQSSMAYFPEAILLLLVTAVGAFWLLVSGARRHEGTLRAARWPWAWLLAAWLLASGLQLATVYAADRHAQQVAAAERDVAVKGFFALTGSMPAQADNAWLIYQGAFAGMDEVLADVDGELQGKKSEAISKASQEAVKHLATVGTQPVEDLESPDELFGRPDSARDLLGKEYLGKPELSDLLRRLEPSLMLVRKATQRPANRFPVTPALPNILDSMKGDVYKHMRHAAVCLQLHAIEQARHGKIDVALDDIAALHRLAGQVDQSMPCLVSGLVRIGVHACAYDALAEALPYATGPLRFPEGVPADEGPLRKALDRDLRGEEQLIIGTLLGLGDGSLDTGRAGGLGRASLAYRILWLEGDIPTLRAIMADNRERLWGRPGNPGLYGRGGVPKGSLIAQLIAPSVGRAITVNDRIEGSARQARIAVALTAYRLKHGGYPATLDALAPEWMPAIPSDPFNKKPMRYRLDGKDAIIYSVGENLKDDGGEIDSHRDDGYRLKQLP